MLNTILIVLVIVAVSASATLLGAHSALRRGRRGERNVASLLSALSSEYRVFNDVYVNVQGRSVQIDHIVVSPYGIFVIETKSYTGWVYGTDYSEFWTKNMYGAKFRFRNPIKQNYGHKKALIHLSGLPDDKFISIVVFQQSASIRCQTQSKVVYANQLIPTIESYRIPKLSLNELSVFCSKLNQSNITDKDKEKKHYQRVRQEIENRRHVGICPHCGGFLIERNGVNGRFIGCSNFPKCRYSQKLN